MIAHSLQSILLYRDERIQSLQKQLRGDITSQSGASVPVTQTRRQVPLEVENEHDD